MHKGGTFAPLVNCCSLSGGHLFFPFSFVPLRNVRVLGSCACPVRVHAQFGALFIVSLSRPSVRLSVFSSSCFPIVDPASARCLCVISVKKNKLLSFFVFISKRWTHGLAVVHQRRHCLFMRMVRQWDAFVTYQFSFAVTAWGYDDNHNADLFRVFMHVCRNPDLFRRGLLVYLLGSAISGLDECGLVRTAL